jgi:hypothetical protein
MPVPGQRLIGRHVRPGHLFAGGEWRTGRKEMNRQGAKDAKEFSSAALARVTSAAASP